MQRDLALIDEISIHVIEVIGVSEVSPRDAVWRAVAGVLNPTRHIVGLDVLDRETMIQEGRVKFRVIVKIAYTCEHDVADYQPAAV